MSFAPTSMPRLRDCLLLVAATACGASESPLEPAKPATHEVRWAIGPPSPLLFVAAVDDRPDGAELRRAVAQAFDQFDAEKNSHGCRGPFDPAAFHPENRSVVVVHPSASEQALVTTELDQPGLHWVTNQPSEAERSAWVEEVTRALEPKDPALGAFTPLHALERVTSLLTKQRPPETAVDVALSALIRQGQYVYGTLAVAHDDEGSEPPESFAPAFDDRFYLSSLLVPNLTDGATPPACLGGSGTTTARYTAWLDALTVYAEPAMYWPCTDLPLVQFLSGSCTGNCLPFTPVVASDGSVDCQVTVDTNAASCDARYGWLDPRRPDGTSPPQFVDVDGVTLRRCEIPELTGAALDSCVHSLDCPDCTPGWCYTQVRELTKDCHVNPNAFRFVAGADAAASAYVHVSCASVE